MSRPVDLSPVQIERARRLVPEASFSCADMTTASLEPGSFDAVVAFWQRDRPNFPNYEAGTWGPSAADELLHRDGRSWRRH